MASLHKNIYLYFLVCIFKIGLTYCWSSLSASSLDPENPEEFEGWVWRSSLNFELPNISGYFVNADSLHQEMATITEKLRSDIIGQKISL